MKLIPATHILQRGTTLPYHDHDLSSNPITSSIKDNSSSSSCTLLYSNTGLSFWGGIHPTLGTITDTTHELYQHDEENEHDKAITDTKNRKLTSRTILAIPNSRGSCTGSQVLLELLLHGANPAGIVLRDVDLVLLTGALVFEEIYSAGMVTNLNKTNDNSSFDNHSIPRKRMPMIALGKEGYEALSKYRSSHPYMEIDLHGNICCFASREQWEEYVQHHHYDQRRKKYEEYFYATATSDSTTTNNSNNSHKRNGYEMAYRILHKVKEHTNATRFIPITRAHIDAVTYIGRGSLLFLQTLLNIHSTNDIAEIYTSTNENNLEPLNVSVPTTLNSGSVDRTRWRELGIPTEQAKQAMMLGDWYVRYLNCIPSFTCAPYLLSNDDGIYIPNTTFKEPGLGENIAWGESNAVVYANSVLGARTMKYPDYLDVCAAICGQVPEIGVHLSEERRAGIILDVRELVELLISSSGSNDDFSDDHDSWDALFPALGYLCGNMAKIHIPAIIGMDIYHNNKRNITKDDLKAFSAAFGTTGTAPMFHMVGITPEAPTLAFALGDNQTHQVDGRINEVETVRISAYDLLKTIDTLDSAHRHNKDDKVDIVALGNPHLSLSEVSRIAELCQGHTRHPNVKAIATLGRQVYTSAQEAGYIDKLTTFGFQFINDTCWCMITEPVVPPNTRQIITNSGKYAHYAPSLIGEKVIVRFRGLTECLNAAKTGRIPPRNNPSSTWMKRLLKVSANGQSQTHYRYFSTMRPVMRRGIQGSGISFIAAVWQAYNEK